MNCKYCGNPVENNADFCSNCGKKIEKSNVNISSNNNGSNKKPKIIIFILIPVIILAIVLIVLGLIFTNEKASSKKENNKLNEEELNKEEVYTHNLYNVEMPKEVKDDNDLSKNIEIYNIFFLPKKETSKYAYAYIYGKNNNNVPVQLDIDVEYYDEEGYRIEKDSSHLSVLKANSLFVTDILVKDDSLNYKDSKLLYSASKIKSYYTDIPYSNIDVTANLLTDKNIDITVKNNSNITMKIGSLACIYYKNNKEVFAIKTSVSDNINLGQVSKAICYNHLLRLGPDYNSETIEFDDYKVVLFEAYNYDSENY